jgi:DUF4097 and DUF4098 domain-containing protein YvlB
MRPMTLFLILILLLSIQACVISCDGISEENMTVDGSKLEHTGEILLDESFANDHLKVSGGIAGIELGGVAETQARIRVKYREFEPSDAIITLSEGQIKTDSKSGKPVLITSISGTIPNNLNLFIESGTGSVKVSDMQQIALLDVDSGTGKVDLQNIQSKAIILDTGTGSVNLDQCVAVSAEINTGTGSISLRDSYIESAEVDTGTGSIYLNDSTIVKHDFNSGTGKIHQEGEYRSAK